MTDQRETHVPQFYLTPAGPCPYLPGREERKIFARLDGPLAQALNNTLTQSGFRRSQTIAYKPSCTGCSACVSVRIVVDDFHFSHNQRRVINRNADLKRQDFGPLVSREQFALLRAYLDSRHAGGGMNDMSLFDYAAMVEETAVRTRIFEYRLHTETGDGKDTPLMATALTDVLADGLSMAYSFFHPGQPRRSLGSFMILDHVRMAKAMGLPYVYLGYWVRGSTKMRYKSRYTPLEALQDGHWCRHDVMPPQDHPLTDIPQADQNGDDNS